MNKSLKEVIKNSHLLLNIQRKFSSTLALSGGLDSSVNFTSFPKNSFALNTLSLDLNASLDIELINSTICQYKCEHSFVKSDKNCIK